MLKTLFRHLLKTENVFYNKKKTQTSTKEQRTFPSLA